MASREMLDALKERLSANTSAVKSATEALTFYATSTAELTGKLKDAIEKDDDAEIEQALAALDANTKQLLDAVPDVAEDIAESTEAEDDDEPEEEKEPGEPEQSQT